MDYDQFLLKVSQLLDEVKVGVLTSLDSEGNPHVRWLTAGFLPDRPGILYTVSSPDFEWVKNLDKFPNIEWMIQNKALTEVFRIQGKIQVIDNPSLKAEVLQTIGKNVSVFWKVNFQEANFVILETIIEKGYYFLPMQGKRIYVEFPKPVENTKSDWT